MEEFVSLFDSQMSKDRAMARSTIENKRLLFGRSMHVHVWFLFGSKGELVPYSCLSPRVDIKLFEFPFLPVEVSLSDHHICLGVASKKDCMAIWGFSVYIFS